jgi:hypothetical protein
MVQVEELKFVTLEQLSEWLTENNKLLSDLTFSDAPPITYTITSSDVTSSSCGTCSAATITENESEELDFDIIVKSLTTQPNIHQIPFCEGISEPNIWYVDDYEFIEDACGTSKIIYKGDTLLMNVCESEGKAMVSLVLEMKGHVGVVEFKLNKICNSPDNYDMILSI